MAAPAEEIRTLQPEDGQIEVDTVRVESWQLRVQQPANTIRLTL